MIFDSLSHAAPYFAGSWWRDVLACAATITTETPVGERQLRGEDLLVRVLDLTTGPAETAVLESHCRYTDVQIVLDGGEFIRVWPAAQLTVKDPYDACKDVMFYEHPASAPVVIDLMPGTFAVFRPQDAHMPALMKGAPARLRKMVFKVSNELIDRER